MLWGKYARNLPGVGKTMKRFATTFAKKFDENFILIFDCELLTFARKSKCLRNYLIPILVGPPGGFSTPPPPPNKKNLGRFAGPSIL